MSYILDALKRAERERKQGQVSVLDEIPSAPALQPQRRRPRWLVPGLASLVALILLLCGVLILRHRGGDTAPPAPAAVAAAQPPAMPPPPPAAAAPVNPPVVEEPPPAAAATIEDGSRIATLDDVADQPDAQTETADEEPPPEADGEVNAGNPQGQRPPPPARLPRQQAGATPPREAAPAPAESVNPEADAGADATAEAPPAQPAAEPPAPTAARRSLKEMPETFRANFPTFTVDVHAYNADPRRRFVLINGKRYHEGDTLAEGPRIVGIVAEGIVFDWQGQQVLYAMAR